MTDTLSPISMTDTLSPIFMSGDSERRAASMTHTTSPISMSGDLHSLWSQPLHAIDMGVQPQHQELQESESELDSPPRITILPVPEEEPDSPTYPTGPTSPGSPRATSVRVNNASESPKDSPNDDEDEYFNYLVDKFVSVAANVCSSTLSDDEPDYKEEIHKKYALCAKRALEHYNNDDKNKVKYELISTTMCNDMLIREGCFSHVNFTAKGNQLNAKELFFAELRWDHGTPVPTCVICFKGIKKIGGLRDSKYDKFYLEGLPIDKQHCYACDRRLKHPRNGELYGIGHVAMSKHYWDSGMI